MTTSDRLTCFKRRKRRRRTSATMLLLAHHDPREPTTGNIVTYAYWPKGAQEEARCRVDRLAADRMEHAESQREMFLLAARYAMAEGVEEWTAWAEGRPE